MNRLDSLEPEFRATVAELITRLQPMTGRVWTLSDGRRTLAQQAILYAQGRSTPGKVVTLALPGASAHNYGLAADLWPMTPGGDYDWSAPDKLFRAMADQAQQLGLVAGYYFKSIHDSPHVEAKNWREKQAAWKAGNLKLL